MADRPLDDLGIDEHFGHIQARPVSWVVVFLVCAGFLVAGIGLIAANPVVFWIGVGVVAAGTILGGVTHAMADVPSRVERRQAKANKVAVVDSEPVR
ncbi:MAG TPA: HGxxPAAW family protein [Acidothermaceae bacterium]